MKKLFCALLSFLFFVQVSFAQNIPLYSGPQDVAYLTGYLNSLVVKLNTIFQSGQILSGLPSCAAPCLPGSTAPVATGQAFQYGGLIMIAQ